MNDEASRSDAPREGRREPYRVRLPGFVSEEDVGLGDAIKRATSTVVRALRRLRTAGRCAQPLDGFLRSTAEVDDALTSRP